MTVYGICFPKLLIPKITTVIWIPYKAREDRDPVIL